MNNLKFLINLFKHKLKILYFISSKNNKFSNLKKYLLWIKGKIKY